MAFTLNSAGPTTLLTSTAGSVGATGNWYRVPPKLRALAFQVTQVTSSVGATASSTTFIQVSNDGVNPIADPEPLRNSFVRSDQYSFIRQGVPAVKMDYGAEPGTPEAKVYKDWLTNRYHAPSDDLNQPVDLAAAANYEEIIRALIVETANNDARPQWKPESFFRRYAKK